jgi:hypothetical protein
VQNPGNTGFPDPVFYIENTATSSVAMADLVALYFVTPESGVSEVRSYEQIDTTSTALSAQILRLGYTNYGIANVAAGTSVKSTFGYHAANWAAQNLNNDYTQQNCNANNLNTKMVLCRKVDGISYQVWGVLPSYDTLGCERP